MEIRVKIVNAFPLTEPEGYEKPEPIVNEFTLKNQKGLKDILAWYGAFYAGDPYTVYVNGSKIKLDRNGEVAVETIEHDNVTLLLP